MLDLTRRTQTSNPLRIVASAQMQTNDSINAARKAKGGAASWMRAQSHGLSPRRNRHDRLIRTHTINKKARAHWAPKRLPEIGRTRRISFRNLAAFGRILCSVGPISGEIGPTSANICKTSANFGALRAAERCSFQAAFWAASRRQCTFGAERAAKLFHPPLGDGSGARGTIRGTDREGRDAGVTHPMQKHRAQSPSQTAYQRAAPCLNLSRGQHRRTRSCGPSSSYLDHACGCSNSGRSRGRHIGTTS